MHICDMPQYSWVEAHVVLDHGIIAGALPILSIDRITTNNNNLLQHKKYQTLLLINQENKNRGMHLIIFNVRDQMGDLL